MAHRPHPAIERILTSLTVGFGRFTGWMPLRMARALGGALGALAYYAVPGMRRVTLSHLDLAYGDTLSPARKHAIGRAAAMNLGHVAAGFTRIGHIDPVFVKARVDIKGWELIDPSRGAVFISAHLGNWEWLAPVVRTLHDKIAEVIRPMNDPRLHTYVDGNRRANGILTIPKAGASQEVIRLLRHGYYVGLLIDQSPREGAMPVQFFGQPTWATAAPVLAAIRTGVPIYPIICTFEKNGKCCLRVYPELILEREGSLRDNLVLNTQKCQEAIEAMIREHPGQWLWRHRRWKRRPLLEEQWMKKTGEGPKSTESQEQAL